MGLAVGLAVGLGRGLSVGLSVGLGRGTALALAFFGLATRFGLARANIIFELELALALAFLVLVLALALAFLALALALALLLISGTCRGAGRTTRTEGTTINTITAAFGFGTSIRGA